jgi:hypothetical protein
MKKKENRRILIAYNDSWDIMYWTTKEYYRYIMYTPKDDTKSKIKIL